MDRASKDLMPFRSASVPWEYSICLEDLAGPGAGMEEGILGRAAACRGMEMAELLRHQAEGRASHQEGGKASHLAEESVVNRWRYREEGKEAFHVRLDQEAVSPDQKHQGTEAGAFHRGS